MKNLGDQWIELIDGVEHMVKAVEKVSEKSYDCTSCVFNGHNGTCMYHSQDCPLGEVEHGYIKDLGILRDGLLSDERTGRYPSTKYIATGEYMLYVTEYDASRRTDTDPGLVYLRQAYGRTPQEAYNNWNRRA